MKLANNDELSKLKCEIHELLTFKLGSMPKT